ncbi:unnamed protein product [Pleuronectes platessa]|uniref:Uncharacterized protein n=1 Tax=Pleuronectes platessa TaxID=8262 RepID=A0A9N7YZ80_PLEPL|nr:unnamed protein product [Pleuronectes platessa]
MESSESGPLSAGSTGRNREEYAMLADLPKVKRIHEREETGHIGIQQVSRRQELFKPASHSLSKHPSREWDDAVDTDRDWHYAGSGHLSRAHSSTSLQRSGSPTADEGGSWRGSHPHRSEHMQVCGGAARPLTADLSLGPSAASSRPLEELGPRVGGFMFCPDPPHGSAQEVEPAAVEEAQPGPT